MRNNYGMKLTSHKLWVSFKNMKLQILCSSYIIFIFKKCVNRWSMFDTSNSIHCHCYNINDIMLFFMMKWMCNMMFVFHRIIISWIYILFSLKKIYEYSSGKNCEALLIAWRLSLQVLQILRFQELPVYYIMKFFYLYYLLGVFLHQFNNVGEKDLNIWPHLIKCKKYRIL